MLKEKRKHIFVGKLKNFVYDKLQNRQIYHFFGRVLFHISQKAKKFFYPHVYNSKGNVKKHAQCQIPLNHGTFPTMEPNFKKYIPLKKKKEKERL